MASTIAAITTGTGGVVTTADSSGDLSLLSGATTVVAVTSAGATVTGTLAASGAVTASTTLAVTGAITATAGINAPNTFGFKNRIINGGMVIDQRNAGAAVTANDAFPVDRFKLGFGNSTGAFSAQQTTTAPAGFINSVKYLTTTADVSLGATEYATLSQPIEGLNVADLAWGTASASTVTLSFWCRSSVTGTFGGALRNSNGTRSYPFTFAISVINTWEQKTITIAGDTSGTWLTTNGVGIYLNIGMGTGTTLSGTAGAWAGANYISATGAVNLIATLNADFYITGVQLEKGSTATSFDFRAYSTELAMCQRYLPAWSGLNSLGTGQSIGSTNCRFNLPLPVTARVSPTGVSVSSASHFATNNSAGTNLTGTAVTFLNAGTLSAWFDISVASGLTAGNASQVFATSSSALLYLTGCEL